MTNILGIPVRIWRTLYLVNLVVITMILAIGYGLPGAHAQNVSVSSARDCDANAVIFCGAGSVNQLINKFDSGDGRNSATSIQNIFSFFGVSAADVHSMANSAVDVRAGNVTSSGQVWDGSGHMVASGAITGGRQNIAGSTRHVVGGTVFFVRPPSVSFVSSPLHAFVVMQNGRFAFAVLASCGNVVKATPTAPAPRPAPPPAPAPAKPTVRRQTTNVCSGNTTNSNTNIASQGGNCSTNTTVVQNQTSTPAPAPTPAPTPAPSPTPAPTTPAATQSPPTCDALNVTQGNNRTVTITSLTTTANGATMTGVDIDWGDGTQATNVSNPTGLTHQFTSDGTFTITATVHFTTPGTTAGATNNTDQSQSATTAGNSTVDGTVSTSANVTADQSMSNTSSTNQPVATSAPTCQQQVSFTTPAPAAPAPVTPSASVTTAPVTTTPATTLVNTGPGSVAGIFAITSVLGTLGHRLVLRRRA